MTVELRVDVGGGAVHVRAPGDELAWSFDPCGRPLAGHGSGGRHLRFGLDGAVVARGPDLSAPPQRLDEAAAARAADELAALARRAAQLLDAGGVPVEPPAGAPEAAKVLARAGARDAGVRAEEARRFARTYGRLEVLPPDCARALLLRVVEGCPWSRCTFCTLYAGVPFRVRGDAELEAHLDEVATLHGEAVALRTRLFLGDANALLAPSTRLTRLMRLARARFPGPARGGFHAFVDAFTTAPLMDDLAGLRAEGLRRVTVGLETGHAPLLAWLGKPASPGDAVDLVRRLRAAALGVGVVVLVGAGGAAFAAGHVEETLVALDAMRLGPGDLVFLSPLVESPTYARRAQAAGLEPLARGALAAQAASLRSALRARGLRTATYDLRRFVP